MKNDESEVVATSTDLSDVKQTILIVSDDKYLVINQNKRVSELHCMYLDKIEKAKVAQTLGPLELRPWIIQAIWFNSQCKAL